MEIYLEYPGLLWLILVPVLLVVHYIWLEVSQRHPHLRVSTSTPWKQVKTPFMSCFRHVPFVFRIAAIVLLIYALARPRSHDYDAGKEIYTEGIDIVMAMDVSTSMLAADLKPNRHEASKNIAEEFISTRQADRIGIVTFAGECLTQSPLTTDKSTLISVMQNLAIGELEDGTAIGNGLALAVSRLSESDAPSRVVILLTDGMNNQGEISPHTALEIAKQYDVKVYTIGVGSEGVAPYPFQNPWGGIDWRNVQNQIDEELLMEISEQTGGKYFRATDETSLAEIYDEINSMEKGRTIVNVSSAITYEEYFFKYLLWAFAALMIELLLNWFVIRKMP